MLKRSEDFAQQPHSESLAELGSNLETGLSQSEADFRLHQYGFNEIQTQEETLFHRVIRRFWGPIPWMIEIAALLSALVQKWEDLIIILIMLFVNAGLDFLQEHRALNALKALKQGLVKETIVKRDGQFKRISSRELVPGDIIKLKIGDIVPADVQLLDGRYLLIDQSSITGESMPVSHKVGEVALANTVVKQGEMLGLIVNTAMQTHFSSIVTLVAQSEFKTRSHFQKMVIKLGNFLILFSLSLVVLVIMVSLFRHDPLMEIARFSLVLLVAAIPVALPAVLSVTMAVGAVNLARKQAIVSRLTAIEELAGMDVFCTDKTGTLTQNQMQIAEPIVLDGFQSHELFLYAALASRLENNDPIEMPIFHYIDEQLPSINLSEYLQQDFTPFDPIQKYTASTISHQDRVFSVYKGAPQIIMEKAELDDETIQELSISIDLLASKGYRTLAVAQQNPDQVVNLIGLIPFYDPPRDDSKAVIDQLHEYGIEVKMITGDNLAIAKEVGRLLGLEEKTLRSAQLSGAASAEILSLIETVAGVFYRRFQQHISPKEARQFAHEVMHEVENHFDTRVLEHEFLHAHESAIIELIEEVDIFAEVVPEDKYRIVDTLQKGGHIVAMTGDGVNDAPALRKADCGFAVSNATDAARAAADIVLTAPGLSVINDAVEQARITFSRMKSYATFRIAETLRIILFLALSIIIFDFYPITTLMIILLALLNDIPILTIAYDNAKVHAKPIRWNMHELITVATVLGVIGVISSFILYFYLREQQYSNELIQTLLFLKLVIAGHSTLYLTRSEGWFWQHPLPASPLVLATFSTEIIATLLAVYGILMPAIGWELALAIWAYCLLWFLINDAAKMLTLHFLNQLKY